MLLAQPFEDMQFSGWAKVADNNCVWVDFAVPSSPPDQAFDKELKRLPIVDEPDSNLKQEYVTWPVDDRITLKFWNLKWASSKAASCVVDHSRRYFNKSEEASHHYMRHLRRTAMGWPDINPFQEI